MPHDDTLGKPNLTHKRRTVIQPPGLSRLGKSHCFGVAQSPVTDEAQHQNRGLGGVSFPRQGSRSPYNYSLLVVLKMALNSVTTSEVALYSYGSFCAPAKFEAYQCFDFG